MKKQPKIIKVSQRPVIIVGEKMGKQRAGQDTYSLEGNRTGDFVHEAIEGIDNIILTNVVNHYYPGNFNHDMYVGEGICDLIELFEEYNPKRIITLGNIAKDYVASIKAVPHDCEVINLPHPSWVNRFKSSERFIYVKNMRHEVIK